MDYDQEKPRERKPAPVPDARAAEAAEVNASGHVQELERNFSFFSICSVGIVTGNTWAVLGGSITVALSNGGPPGVLYEFLVVSLFYFFLAASLAELASAAPSSGGVYHWASITGGPRYGRICGWYAGFWNCSAWLFGAASMAAILGNQTVQMYALFHPDFVPQKWHVFVAYVIATWACAAVVLFANRALPALNILGLVFILGGVLVTILVCAIMPATTGSGYASNAFVWRDWDNQVGYGSDGFVFLMGMLNGAFAVGTPDCVSHLAEEIPHPQTNIPKAIAAQMCIGFFTAFLYLIAIFYATTDLTAVLSGTAATLPLAEIYHQATNSRGGALGLILVIFLPSVCTLIGGFITTGRTLWTLARDDALPGSRALARVSPRWQNPFNATLACAVALTFLGCIYVGSSTAFNAFVGSFSVLSTLSYVAAIGPHLLSGRRHVTPGPFWMAGWRGTAVGAVGCAYVLVFAVVYCFPYTMPVTAQNMNYTCVITGGLTILYTAWWFWKGKRGYKGPAAVMFHYGGAGVEGGA